ncbi:MAG: hypothetical protein GF331_23200 [Chitinivibrionales bacterium]|nr:hypothetical protein [Chitinivibrionales bacterium]
MRLPGSRGVAQIRHARRYRVAALFGTFLDWSLRVYSPERACRVHCHSFSSRRCNAQTSSAPASLSRDGVRNARQAEPGLTTRPPGGHSLSRPRSTARATMRRHRCSRWCASTLRRGSVQRFDEFERVYPERYQRGHGYWRPVVRTSVDKYVKCGDLNEGFARISCPDCGTERFLASSCRQRGCCPACDQSRSEAETTVREPCADARAAPQRSGLRLCPAPPVGVDCAQEASRLLSL